MIKEQIIELWLAGKNKSEISREVKTSYSYVHNVVEIYKLKEKIKEQDNE